ncbi:MAG: DUF2125 domain-containing protein [Pseudomonadota bacterium]|nr:DUF2125 domain-containing protein [Pseudomonadota bacterium]
MSRWTQLAGATALACVFSASASVADISGQEVWDDWKSYMEDFGYTITGTESRSGDTLTVADIEMSLDIPQDDSSVSMTMPELTFTDQGDGTVSIGMPEQSVMTIDGQSSEGDAFNVSLGWSLTGMSTIVSGSPENMTYSYTAASMALELLELDAGEDTPEDLQAVMTVDNLIGQSTMALGDARETQQTMSAQGVTYELRVVDPTEDANVVMTGGIEGLQFDGGGVIPIGVDMEDPAALFKSGFAMDGTFRQAGADFQMTIVEDGQPTNIETSNGAGELKVAVSEAGLEYAGGAADLSVNLVGGEIPFPVSFTMEEIGYEFMMPMAASEQEQDFALGMTLGGLIVPDMLWNIFDPSAILPRDAATVSFDIDGKTRLFKDLMDPSLEETEEFPGELTALTLSDLVVEVAGAELTGSGDFTFDNSDLESFDGMPRPEGAADFRLLGGNALLDKVIQMGFVSQEEAMGARMMMGLFARPGPAEDELNSRIEVNEQGHVLANGQRLR